jgi:hypothetical protein
MAPSSIVSYGYAHIRLILESFGAKLAEFVTWGRTIWMNWAFDRLRMPERWPFLHVSYGNFSQARFQKMNQRDQELLDKQLRRLNPPRSDGVMILAILAVFFAGMALGGFLFPYKSEAMPIASNDATPGILHPNGAPLTTRR